MNLVYRRHAVKILRGTQPEKAADISAAVIRIAAEPFAPNNNIRPLRGIRNGYRVRVGDWRVSYTLDRNADVIEVFEIAPKGGAYR
jgi:mRNA interferase RelE/StbE